MSSCNQETALLQLEIPTGIRFHHNGLVVAAGRLEYIDNVFSIVTLTSISGGLNDLPASFGELKKQQYPKVYEILEKLYPKKNNIVTTWAARVSIQVNGEWKMIEQGNKKVWRKGKHVLVGQPKFSRNYLVENAVNTKSIDEFSDLFQSDSQTNPRGVGENNVNLTTKKRKLENDTEPNNTPKKSRIEGVVPSSLIDERIATRNSYQSTSSSDTTVDDNHTKIARQVRCLMSAIESQLTQKTLEMERTRAEYNRLHDQIQELQRRKELLEQIA